MDFTTYYFSPSIDTETNWMMNQVGSRLLADSKAVALSLELEAATARLLHRRREGERMEEESARSAKLETFRLSDSLLQAWTTRREIEGGSCYHSSQLWGSTQRNERASGKVYYHSWQQYWTNMVGKYWWTIHFSMNSRLAEQEDEIQQLRHKLTEQGAGSASKKKGKK